MNLPASFSRGRVKWKRHTPNELPAPRQWWRLYHDATLNSLVERALANNQDIAAGRARLQQAREISRQARSLYFPSIDLGANASRSKSLPHSSSGSSILSNNFSIPVDFSYELDVWGKTSRKIESAHASEAATMESLNALKLSVAGDVAQTYWALRAVDADRDVLARTLETRRQAFNLLTKLHDSGTVSGLDLSRAESEVATAEADRIQMDQSRLQLVNALAVLAGSFATGSSISENPRLPSPPSIPVSVPSELLLQRPDIRAAEHRVAAANADIGVATAAFYPSFAINASSGLAASNFGDLFQASALVWSIGANMLAPISQQNYLRSQRNAAVAAHEAVSAEYRQTVLNAVREVENALQGANVLRRRQVALEKEVAAANKTLDLSAKRFKAGLTSYLDVVDAERARLNAERSASAARGQSLAISVSLAKALGGEW